MLTAKSTSVHRRRAKRIQRTHYAVRDWRWNARSVAYPPLPDANLSGVCGVTHVRPPPKWRIRLVDVELTIDWY